MRASPARRAVTAAGAPWGHWGAAGPRRPPGAEGARVLCVLRASGGRLRPVLPVSHVLSSFPSRVSAKWRLKYTVPFCVLSSLPPENQRSPCRANNSELAAELAAEPRRR